MIRVIFIFILLLASIYLGIQLNKDPGYLLIAINQWTIETTLWVALAALFLSFIVLHGLLVLFHRIGQFPAVYQQWKTKRRAQKAQSTTRQGLIEFSEGYWSSAKNHLIKALPDTDTPLLNYLTAARAAQEMGENQLRDDYLREAQQSMPDAKIAVELTQAQLQLANQQWEQALATLRHLQDLAPHHPYVLKLLMHLYQEVRDWPQLIALLPELKRNDIVTGYAFEKLRHYTYLQAMCDLTRLGNLDALTNMVYKLPKPLKFDPDLMACYGEFLIKNNQSALAEPILRRCLRKEFNEKLVTLYGQFYIDEKQLAFAESLLKKHPNSAALNLCLGHLCIENNLWGKAKNYLEKSISLKETPVAYAQMGKLYERFGEQEAACEAYRQGLKLVTRSE
ncbi:MAG: heme biosynthesis HemY N-terminal domain-containing protein [Legionella sp.]|nr:heme biosynthesis HemY N-terminal domain-containing protein [Legionella sp.]